ncbi:MAG TPA: hypothetical protein VFR43_12895 [Gaiellaceae bacterium]|nr:hypothetical protein [Gaiellaceae bacterium]
MEIEVVPAVGERERAVLVAALTRAGVEPDGRPPAYASRWRRAGLAEALEREPARRAYALSPRSSRGATRA